MQSAWVLKLIIAWNLEVLLMFVNIVQQKDWITKFRSSTGKSINSDIMMKINIKKTSIVRPIQDTPNERIWLSKLDLQYTKRGYVPTVYFYRHDGSSKFFEAEVLKETLSKVLVKYYPVAGRLAMDENGRVEINCNGEGVLFVEAETDFALYDLGHDFTPGEQLMKLIPALALTYSNETDLSSYPLLILQVARFTCGGVSLGVGCHHSLADGAGALQFFDAWSSIARGLSVTVVPFMDRTVLRPRDPPTPTFDHLEFCQPPTLNKLANQLQSGSEANSTTIFKITADQIKTLKSMARSNQNQNNTSYSTNEVLAAYLWRTTCKARGLSDGQQTMMTIPMDGRSRLNPPLPRSYFGNAIFIVPVIALSGDLLSEPFIRTVERIREAMKRRDDRYLRSAIDYIETMDDINGLMRGPQSCRCPNLNVPNWLRLPFHHADFGWGNPICFRPGSVFEGKGYLLPSPADDGSVSLAICLETEHMPSFQNLFYASFREHQTEAMAK